MDIHDIQKKICQYTHVLVPNKISSQSHSKRSIQTLFKQRKHHIKIQNITIRLPKKTHHQLISFS